MIKKKPTKKTLLIIAGVIVGLIVLAKFIGIIFAPQIEQAQREREIKDSTIRAVSAAEDKRKSDSIAVETKRLADSASAYYAALSPKEKQKFDKAKKAEETRIAEENAESSKKVCSRSGKRQPHFR